MAIDIATEITQGKVSDNLFNTIIDEDDPQQIQEQLKVVCLQVRSGVVYAILQELLTYSKINKPKDFDKSVTSHFSKVGVLVKQLRAAVTSNRDIWDTLTIVVAINVLHNKFDYIISRLLGQGGKKSVAEIQSLLSFAEAKLLSKKAVGVIVDLVYMSRNSSHKRKTTTTSKDKCFNCHKIGHYRKDCKYPDYRLLNKKRSSNNTRQDRDCNNSLRARQNNNTQPCKANVTANLKDENSDLKPFCPKKAFITTKLTIMSRTKSMWYLDLCTSRHLTNNQNLFIGEIRPKTWDFRMAGG